MFFLKTAAALNLKTIKKMQKAKLFEKLEKATILTIQEASF